MAKTAAFYPWELYRVRRVEGCVGTVQLCAEWLVEWQFLIDAFRPSFKHESESLWVRLPQS